MTGATSWVLGVDSGGSGLRVALAPVPQDQPYGADPAENRDRGQGDPPLPEPVGPVLTADPVPTTTGGIDPDQLLARLLPAGRELLASAPGKPRLAAVCIGAAGMATLGERLRAELPGELEREWGVRRLALAADAVTGYAGALGDQPGAVVAAGTGLIALGTDLHAWRRADGWGHLLGDCGGGAWIGRAGLESALRAHDGRSAGSHALLARATERFGSPATLPGQLYPRADRAALLASFAPEVAGCASSGDPVAKGILRQAAHDIVDSAAAALPGLDDAGLALTGGLLRLGEALLTPLHAELETRLPSTPARIAEGSPLGGALLIAAHLVQDDLRMPADQRLLTLT